MVLELVTSLTDVVWLLLALRAEVIFTFSTANSMQTHVNGSMVADLLARIVLLIEIDISLVDFHDRATRTLSKVLVDKHHLAQRLRFNVIFVFLCQVFIELPLLNRCLASWASARTAIQSSDASLFSQAITMHCVEALCRLQEHVLLPWSDLFETPSTETRGHPL